MAAAEILRKCGVVLGHDELPIQALKRHAREKGWRVQTLRKWMELLRNALILEANRAFNDLDKLNGWLQGLGMPEQKSMRKAQQALKTVFINIYDLLANRFHARMNSLQELRKYSRKNKLFYPLKQAKDQGLRAFLKHLWG